MDIGKIVKVGDREPSPIWIPTTPSRVEPKPTAPAKAPTKVPEKVLA